MNATTTHQQPAFAENIVAAVSSEINNARTDLGSLVVVRPDYTRPIDIDNFFRTSLYLSGSLGTPEERMVHISNQQYDADTIAVVFQSGPRTSKTRHYQSSVQMAQKAYPVSNITYRNKDHVHLDITEFLLHGKVPA